MSQSSTTALLIYADDLHESLVYVLHRGLDRWRLAALDPDIVPNLTRDAAAHLLAVEAGANLRTAEPGAITTVTKL